jgi:hypothetical protein
MACQAVVPFNPIFRVLLFVLLLASQVSGQCLARQDSADFTKRSIWQSLPAASGVKQPGGEEAPATVLPKSVREVGQKVTIFQLPPHGEALAARPKGVEIYQVDAEPLGERQPFLLIHGGNGEHLKLFHWEKVLARFNQDERFRKRYKPYLLRYNSSKLLEELVPEARSAVLSLSESCNSKPITIMALSMGGNIVEIGMEDPEFDLAVDRIIALGTPFHGSPLFSSDWFQYSLYKSKVLSVFKVLDSLDYRVYFSWHKNYQQDLKWDDSDELVPQVGHFRSKLPFGPKGNLTVDRDTSALLSAANHDRRMHKKKFTTFAGYLLNSYVLDKERDRLRWKLFAPFRFMSTQIRAQVGGEQAALLVLNREISKIDSGPAGTELGAGQHVYALNDGITPVSSALFLPDSICRTHLLLRESDLLAILPYIDVAQARAFRNIDHVTFVEGKPPHHGSHLVRDSMHPQEGMHGILDWMLAELLQCRVSELASGDGSLSSLH